MVDKVSASKYCDWYISCEFVNNIKKEKIVYRTMSEISEGTTHHKYEKSLDDLLGKNILFLDLETTGIPWRKDKTMPGKYDDYTNNTRYESSRIVQLAYFYCENFSKEFDFDIDDIMSIIRKPNDFNMISEEVVKIHGITYERAMNEGIEIKDIFGGNFGECFMNCDYFVAYNAYFDFSILANEIHRMNDDNMYDKILDLKDNNVFCMCDFGKQYTGRSKRQIDLYKDLYQKDPQQHHDAKNDVYIMLEILRYITRYPETKILDNDSRKNNAGNSWDQKEENELKKLYIDECKSISEIALIHKRTYGAIKSRLKKLNVLIDSCNSTKGSKVYTQ